MLRIPNPGSNIEQFVKTFRAIYPKLSGMTQFGMDDIGMEMVATGMVTSQGAVGPEAWLRSVRENRSQDPIYNQAKMYSELYRVLGWIVSTGAALQFQITQLGDYVAAAKDPRPLVIECFLAMAFPTPRLTVKGTQDVRPFSAILHALQALRTLSRDEVIAGPMSTPDDSTAHKIGLMNRDLRTMRSSPGQLDKRLDRIAAERKIKRHPTMGNYVRIPMALPLWAQWATRSARGDLALTATGEKAATELAQRNDLRLEAFSAMSALAQSAAIVSGHFRMLERAGFAIGSVMRRVEAAERVLLRAGKTIPLHFSPHQQLPQELIAKLAPDIAQRLVGTASSTSAPVEARSIEPQAAPPVRILAQAAATAPQLLGKVAACHALLSQALNANGGDIRETAARIHRAHRPDQKDTFYPFVAALFTIAGFDCEVSRHGVNASREDAMIKHAVHSMPVEIKSPGEEVELSVKGVRQALENKIILLARNGVPHQTQRSSTTWVAGYNRPNDRSDVHELIEDIFTTYGINVCVIDLQTLLCLALSRIQAGTPIGLDELLERRGVLNVEVG